MVLFLFLIGSVFPASAWTTEDILALAPANQSIRFAAVCTTAEEVRQGIRAGADYLSVSGSLTFSDALQAIEAAGTDSDQQVGSGKPAEPNASVWPNDAARVKILIDVTDTAQADSVYNEAEKNDALDRLCLRFHAKSKAVKAWLDSRDKNVSVIGCYRGNIYFSAVNCIRAYAGCTQTEAVQLQTKNPFGVVLHSTVTTEFAKCGVKGMFSFADPTVSAGRMDCSQSWDDVIARGYTVIETAYPEDFAAYLAANTNERAKLIDCILEAQDASTQACPGNRVKEYDKALAQAKVLIKTGNNSVAEMTKARVRLDLAVRNLTVKDGKTVKGDVAITPARIGAAVFGICFVVLLQIFFRSRWAKKEKSDS